MAVDSLFMLCLWLFLDGATLGVASTPLLLFYARRFDPWQVALAGGAASAAGSVVQLVALRWMVARGRPWMRRFMPSRKRIERATRQNPTTSFLAIAIARATPLPDAPVKIAAAIAGYPALLYFAALMVGALPYYFLLAYLGHRFHLPVWSILAIAGAFLAGLAADRWRRRADAADA